MTYKSDLITVKNLQAAITALIILTTCFAMNATAGLITLNDTTEIKTLSLSESFISFYSYGSPNNASANTGFEEEATAIMFLAEFNNNLVLFTLLDAKGLPHKTRKAKMT